MLKSRTKEVQDAADLFANLSINGKKVTPEEMEWKYGGGIASRLAAGKISNTLDSDDDDAGEENPLKVLAEKEALGKATKKSLEKNIPNGGDKHTQKVAFKGDSTDAKVRFMPFNSIKSETLKETEKVMAVGLKRRDPSERKKVELMPLPPNEELKRELKMVTIEESLKIQRDQTQMMKELQIKNAIEKLKQGKIPESGLSELASDPEAMAKLAGEMNYREPAGENDGSELDEGEEEEEPDPAHDEPDYENPINS